MLIVSDSLSTSLRVLLSSPKDPNSIQEFSKAGKLSKVREQRPLVLLLHNCIYLGSSPVYAVSKNGAVEHNGRDITVMHISLRLLCFSQPCVLRIK